MRRCLLLVALLSATGRAGAAALSVPIVVSEPAGVPRTAAHVTVGVPLPRGAATADTRFWVSGPKRAVAPSQTRTLESWPDGSPRWVLVEFLATIAAGARVTYSLQAGAPPKTPAHAPVTVETGP